MGFPASYIGTELTFLDFILKCYLSKAVVNSSIEMPACFNIPTKVPAFNSR